MYCKHADHSQQYCTAFLKDAKSVDMNIVQILNDDMNIDIVADVKNKQEIFKDINKQKEAYI